MMTKTILFLLLFCASYIGGHSAQNLPPVASGSTSSTYTKAMNNLLLDLRQQMLDNSFKFDEHFRSLLSSSKVSLHNMFADTYGMMYERNTEIFTGMFESLEQYYAYGQTNLTKSMEHFFVGLYQKIFQAFNSNKVFPSQYLECATQQLAILNPFKDIPEKLINEIRHAFVAARTFHEALKLDIGKMIIAMGQPTQCINLINDKLLKNSSLAHPSAGTTGPRLPCLNYCEQVIIRCMGRANWETMDKRWRLYVDALNELGMKLSTSYNIETIINPLDIQISEAIMNFQENGHNISQKVYEKCGRPISNSSFASRIGKRAVQTAPRPMGATTSSARSHHQSVSPASTFHSPLSAFTLGSHLRAATHAGSFSSASSLVPTDLTPLGHQFQSPKLIEEIRTSMLSMKGFWSSYPSAVCTSNYTLGNPSAARKQANCFKEPLQLHDMNSELRFTYDINKVFVALEDMREKMEKALAGIEFQWPSPSPEPMAPSLVNPNSRFSFPVTTTTTTTTPSPEPLADDRGEDDLIEPGSGMLPEDTEDIHPEDDSSEEAEIDSSTENLDGDESSDDSNSDTTALPNPVVENQDNSIDQPVQPIDDTQISLITPPTQSDAQKSSQTSSKLVISNLRHITFAHLLLVALFIVTKSSL